MLPFSPEYFSDFSPAKDAEQAGADTDSRLFLFFSF